jgi:pimeloyl-ACP methyl ester carboxylesterase
MTNAIPRRTFLTTAAAATAAGAFGASSRAQHRTIEVGDVALECTSRGSGVPVVLLANAGCSVGYFDYLADVLATRGFQAVSINMRGVAGSRGSLDDGTTLHDLAGDVAGVIEAIGGGPAHLVGHAFGNRIARCLAFDQPPLVRSVTLLAAGGLIAPPTPVGAPFRNAKQAKMNGSDCVTRAGSALAIARIRSEDTRAGRMLACNLYGASRLAGTCPSNIGGAGAMPPFSPSRSGSAGEWACAARARGRARAGRRSTSCRAFFVAGTAGSRHAGRGRVSWRRRRLPTDHTAMIQRRSGDCGTRVRSPNAASFG